MIGTCASCGPVALSVKNDKGKVRYPCSRGRLEQRDPRRWGGAKGAHGFGDADGKALRSGRVCAICSEAEDMCIDHDHATGAVRGILCRRCNLAIGILGDTSEMLYRAFLYLKQAEEGISG